MLCAVQVTLPESDMKAGLALQPYSLDISLMDRPITDLLFTQFIASISGSVSCLGELFFHVHCQIQLDKCAFCLCLND